MDKGTYKMEFICDNCGCVNVRELKKGAGAKGNGGVCSYCGKTDYGNFYYQKPKQEWWG